MGAFWDARAREDAFYFVDNRRAYGDPEADQFWASGEHDLQQILDLLEVTITPQQTVLDIGCGPGRLTRAIARRAGRAVGIDVSAEMLLRARSLNAGIHNTMWLIGDGTSLQPLQDASVDAVISHVVFQHIPDPAITLGYIAEIGRVLKQGGWAAFQISNDPAIHRPRHQPLRTRLASLRGRAPRGQDEPPWLGSAVKLDALRRTAEASNLDVERVLGEGTQYCMVRVRRR